MTVRPLHFLAFVHAAAWVAGGALACVSHAAQTWGAGPRASYHRDEATASLQPDKTRPGGSSDGVRRPSAPEARETPEPSLSLRTISTAAAALCGVDDGLLWRMFLRESSGRHWGPDGAVLRSSAGAVGLGQIKPSTAAEIAPADVLDVVGSPWDNAVASACHLRRLIDSHGGAGKRGAVRKALHDYHAGAYRTRTTARTLAYAADIMEAAR